MSKAKARVDKTDVEIIRRAEGWEAEITTTAATGKVLRHDTLPLRMRKANAIDDGEREAPGIVPIFTDRRQQSAAMSREGRTLQFA